MLGSAPYLRTWEGRRLQNQQSVHLWSAQVGRKPSAHLKASQTT